MDQLDLSNGYYPFKHTPHNRINPYNFAVNDRCYNIFNTHTFYDSAMINNEAYTWGATSVNADTALGMPNLH
jgi:hypothetical protein